MTGGLVNVLCIQRISPEDVRAIEGVDSRVELVDAGGWFDGEIRHTWPEATWRRYLRADAKGEGTPKERDSLLANAEVILGGWPFPLDLRARSPRLRWFHQRPAGASNLLKGDLWGSDVTVTTSRGLGNTLPIAEYVLASMLYFAKGLGQAHRDRAARVTDFLTTDDTVGGLERDGADEVVAKVLCDLEGQLAGLALDRDRGGQRVVDVGDRVMRELDVDDGAGDARDAADDRGLLGGCGGSHGHSLSCQVYLPDARASAPPTISAICCVISACRALLRRRG